MICDMEAGLGVVSRIEPGRLDVVVVVAEPSAKSIDVAARAARIAVSRARVIVVANRVREPADLDAVRAALGDHDLVVVPDEPAIARADRDGRAPIDVDRDAPGVAALIDLAARLDGMLAGQ